MAIMGFIAGGGATGVARENKTCWSRGVNRRLLARPKAVDGLRVVGEIRQRCVGLPSQTVSERQILANSVLILGEEIVLISSRPSRVRRALGVAIGYTQKKIQ